MTYVCKFLLTLKFLSTDAEPFLGGGKIEHR